jgi:predicted MFS family arabinose efflux permease
MRDDDGVTGWSAARIAAVVAGITVLVLLNILPVLVAGLGAALSLNAVELGRYVSAETLGIAGGTLAGVPALRRFSVRAVAGVGLMAVFASDGVSYFLAEMTPLTVARGVGGIGTGLTLAACFQVYGESFREQNFAVYTIGQTTLAWIVIAILPALTSAADWHGVFAVLAILIVPALLLVKHLPARVIPPEVAVKLATYAIRTPPDPWLRVALAGVILFFLGQGAVWTFLESMGLADGVPAAAAHTCLEVCAAFGVLGGLAVLALGQKLRPWIPLLTGLGLTILGVSLVRTSNPWIFGAAISAFYFCLPVFAAYQFAVIAAADPSRHAAVLVSAATFGGFGLAPYLGGELVSGFGYSSLQILDVAFMTAAVLCLLPLLKKGAVRGRRNDDSARQPV